MNREQAEKLLAALIFDDLDEASKAELLAYLQTDDELRDRLRDLQMTIKLAGDAVNEGPDPVLHERRLKQLKQLAQTGKTTRRIFTLRPLVGVAAVVALGLVLAGTFIFPLGDYVGKSNARSDEVGTAMSMDQTHSTAPATRPSRPPAPRTLPRAPARAPGSGTDDIVSSAVAELARRTGAAATNDKEASASVREYADEARQNTPTAGARYADTPGGQAMIRGNGVASDEFSTQVPAEAEVPVRMEGSTRDSFRTPIDVLKRRLDPAQVVASDTPSVPQPENRLMSLSPEEAFKRAIAKRLGGASPPAERELPVTTKANGLVEGESLAKSKSQEVPPGMGGLARGTASSGGGMMGGMGGMGGYSAGIMLNSDSTAPPATIQEMQKKLQADAQTPPTDAAGKIVTYGWSGPVTVEKPPVSMSTTTPGGPTATSDTDLSRLGGWSGTDDRVGRGGMGDPTPPAGLQQESKGYFLTDAPTPSFDADGDGVTKDRQSSLASVQPAAPVTTPAPSGPAGSLAKKPLLGDVPLPGGYFRKEFQVEQDSKDLVLMRDARVDSSAITDGLYADEIRYPTRLEGTERPSAEEADAGLPSQSYFRTVPVNPWVMTERDPLSTFALDVDTASYALCRRYILNGFLPPVGAVRMEEFINAFDYAYPQRDDATFAVYAEGAPAPFALAGQDLTLLKIAVKARTVGRDQRRAAHLVFVVDASASMGQTDRLPPVRSALSLLVDKLSEADRVSLVTCAADARLHLEAVPAREKDKIRQTIEAIQPAGSTNLAAGLKLGYSLARRAFVAGQINQVVLCSDGVANVGQTEAEALLQEVAEDRKQGITITCVGVGYGAYNDALLEAMADRGDGRYVFLDPSPEARETLVGQLAATLQTVARDARIQVQFNPARVRRYRLIGYENRDIEDQRFRDDTIDAGEVGSGQCSTALYELELTDYRDTSVGTANTGNRAGEAIPLSDRGQDARGTKGSALGTVLVRYRNAESGRIEEISRPLSGSIVRRRSVAQDPRFFLAAGAARFAEWLRQSEHAQPTSLAEIQRLLDEVSIALSLDRDVRDLAALAHRAEGLPRAP